MNRNTIKEARNVEIQVEGTLKLRKALLLDGRELNELPYDFGQLTAKDLIDADKDRFEENNSIVYVQTIDTTSLLCLFARAVAYKVENCTMNDIKRLSALDAQAAVVLARRFFSQNPDAADSVAEASETL